MLIRRKARDYFSALKPYLEPKSDPELRALALVERSTSRSCRRRPPIPKLGLGVYRARLARGERDQAIDWFLARGAALQPNPQAEAMADWIAIARRPPDQAHRRQDFSSAATLSRPSADAATA